MAKYVNAGFDCTESEKKAFSCRRIEIKAICQPFYHEATPILSCIQMAPVSHTLPFIMRTVIGPARQTPLHSLRTVEHGGNAAGRILHANAGIRIRKRQCDSGKRRHGKSAHLALVQKLETPAR